MTSELLTVAALPTAAEAEIVRGRLREAGVEAVLVEPETDANAPVPARVHVRVTPADFDRAMRVVFPIPQIVGSRRPAVGSEERIVGEEQPAVGEEQQAVGEEEQAVGSRQPAVSAAENRQPEMPVVSEELPDPRSPTPDPFLNPDPRPPTPDPLLNPEPPLNAGPRPMPEPRLHSADPLRIVVPAMEFMKAGSRVKTIEPTAIVDRAAKRAWWCAVAGIGVCPLLVYPAWWTAIIAALALPALGYSICVVHSIGLRNLALSRTGNRHFFGSLGLIALFIVLTFASMAMRQ